MVRRALISLLLIATPVAAQSDSAIAPEVFPTMMAGLLMLALAVFILVKDRSKRINIAFATLFIARGLFELVSGLWSNQGKYHVRPDGPLDVATGGLAHHLFPVASIIVLFAALYFLFAFIATNHAAMATRMRMIAAICIAAAAALVLLYLAVPGIWWDANMLPTGPLFAIVGLYYPLYAIFGLLLILNSVSDIPDDRRNGAFWCGLGFLFVPMFLGPGEFLFVDVLDYFGVVGVPVSLLGTPFLIAHWAALLSILPTLAAGVILARDYITRRERRGAQVHMIAYLIAFTLTAASLAFATLLFGNDAESAHAAFGVFTIFQGIWAIPYPVFVAYGLTRYQDSTEQDRMRKQIRRFGLGSVFFTVFFAVSEGLEALASGYGDIAGLASAAGLTLILGPIQEKLQHRFMDEHEPPETETKQELDFYREQVRRTLSDGNIGEVERKFLDNLKDTMGLTDETAQGIEAGLRQELGLDAPPAPPVADARPVRCHAAMPDRTRCTNQAMPEGKYCQAHAVAKANAPVRCHAAMPDRTRCTKRAAPDGKYCAAHAAARANAPVRCHGALPDGTRCRRRATPGSKHCGEHASAAA